MASNLEIERKFRVAELPPDLDRHPSGDLQQGYVALHDDGVEVRVRREGDERTLTIKSGPAMTRVEESLDLDERRFDVLWALTEGRRVDKTRYRIPLGDLTVELDVYHGDLDGLVTAEIEFSSEEASAAFEAPAWLGTEVTRDKAYANQALATRGAPTD